MCDSDYITKIYCKNALVGLDWQARANNRKKEEKNWQTTKAQQAIWASCRAPELEVYNYAVMLI